MVCPAPTSRSSGGRSAVRTSRGTRASRASCTAGASSAAAVPDVTVTAAGRPVALARPRAKKPEQRSSTCDQARRRFSRASAMTRGEEREPGEVQASVIPQRPSSSKNARRREWVSVPAGIMWRVRRTVVLLHGFTHTGRSWDPVAERLAERYRALAPDIRGHGEAGERRPVAVAECVADVAEAVPAGFALAGYSIGGRLALN